MWQDGRPTILTVSTVVVAELAQGARARRHDREVEIDVPDACATRSIGRAVRPLHDAGNQGRWQGRCHRQAVSNPLTNQPSKPERFGVADGLPPRVGHDRRSILLNPDPAALDCPLTSERWGNCMKRLSVALMLISLGSLLTGCVAEPAPVARPGYIGVRGHYGPYGGWRPGHWEPGWQSAHDSPGGCSRRSTASPDSPAS